VLKAVALISKRKSYQIGLMVFLGLIFHMMNIAMLSPAVLFINPSFTCEGSTATYSE
jgi:MFS family permease